MYGTELADGALCDLYLGRPGVVLMESVLLANGVDFLRVEPPGAVLELPRPLRRLEQLSVGPSSLRLDGQGVGVSLLSR